MVIVLYITAQNDTKLYKAIHIREQKKYIRAFYARNDLQFSATWRKTNEAGERVYGSLQVSTNKYGRMEAIKMVLDARAKGAGVAVPTPEQAWKIISKKLIEWGWQ